MKATTLSSGSVKMEYTTGTKRVYFVLTYISGTDTIRQEEYETETDEIVGTITLRRSGT